MFIMFLLITFHKKMRLKSNCSVWDRKQICSFTILLFIIIKIIINNYTLFLIIKKYVFLFYYVLVLIIHLLLCIIIYNNYGKKILIHYVLVNVFPLKKIW